MLESTHVMLVFRNILKELKIVMVIKKIVRLVKQKIFHFLAVRCIGSFGSDLKINHFSRFTKNTYLGSNCNFNGCVIVGEGQVKIGNNFHSGSGIQMITSFHNYDAGTEIPYDKTLITKDIIIGDQVWLGNNVIILGGVNIEEGSVIQAGSTVVSDIPYCAVAGGSPARVFKHRNIDHYNELKAAEKFH